MSSRPAVLHERRDAHPVSRAAGLLLAGAWILALAAPAGPCFSQPTAKDSDQMPAPSAASDTTSGSAFVDQWIREALSHAPSLDVIRETLASSRERVRPAGALADPMVSTTSRRMGDVWQSELELEQQLPFPGTRRTRRLATQAEVEVRSRELAEARRMIARTLREIFADLYSLDQERDAALVTLESLRAIAGSARIRYGTGAGDLQTPLRVELEASHLEERLIDLEAERASTASRLLPLLARDDVAQISTLPAVAVTGDSVLAQALHGSAEVATRRAELLAAEATVAMVRAEARPNLTAGALYMPESAESETGYGFRVGIELPIWRGSKQVPLIRAAERDRAAANARVREAEARTTAAARELLAQWTRAERQLTLHREKILPQSSAVVDAARSAYSTGRGDFTAVLEAFRYYLEDRAHLAYQESERYKTWARLVELTGEEPLEDAK